MSYKKINASCKLKLLRQQQKLIKENKNHVFAKWCKKENIDKINIDVYLKDNRQRNRQKT